MKKKTIWLRLGGEITCDTATSHDILRGDKQALKNALLNGGFNLNGETYIPGDTHLHKDGQAVSKSDVDFEFEDGEMPLRARRPWEDGKHEFSAFEMMHCSLREGITDSLLLDSGVTVYSAVVDGKWEVSLRTCGDVKIIWKEESYRYPQDFPEELKKVIRKGKLDSHPDASVVMNNWYEMFVYAKNGDLVYNDVWDEDISTLTEEQAKNDILDVIRRAEEITGESKEAEQTARTENARPKDINPFRVPDLDPMYEALKRFIKTNQQENEKGYILTDIKELDSIYAIHYNYDEGEVHESHVKAIRVDEYDDIQVLIDIWNVNYDDEAVKSAKHEDWYDIRFDDFIYYVPTIFSIAENIQEYVKSDK